MHSPSRLRQWRGILNVSRAPLQWLSQTQHSSASTLRGRKRNKMEGKSEEEGRGILCVPPFLRHRCFCLLLAPLSLSICSSRTASGFALWQLINQVIQLFIVSSCISCILASTGSAVSKHAGLHPAPCTMTHKPVCMLCLPLNHTA